jgi:type IV pilus assembly protein PilB
MQFLSAWNRLFGSSPGKRSGNAKVCGRIGDQGMSQQPQQFGDLLVKDGLITPEQLGKALQTRHESGQHLGSILAKLGLVSDEDFTNFLSKQYGLRAVDINKVEIDASVLKLVSYEAAKRYVVLPISRVGASIALAMADPTNMYALDEIKAVTGFKVEPVVAAEHAMLARIEKEYNPPAPAGKAPAKKAASAAAAATAKANGAAPAQAEANLTGYPDLDEVMEQFGELAEDIEIEAEEEELALGQLESAAEEAPIVRLVNSFMANAVKRGASDIHLEPYEREYRVRYRIDGVLQTVLNPPPRVKNAVISRVKIMAKLDISEKRLPQDGRIMLKIPIDGHKKELDFRVSTLPTLWGEKVVLRLLDKDNLRLDMTKLGFEPESLVRYERAILNPYGMVLVTGPTGSGKTNTLYSSISRLNHPNVNIMTAEDPVEFQLQGINQVQIKDQIGLNFASALRAFLRQDPNIILVGEIRDFETAEIAIKAALTGHLVLSTLHTNGAPETISRLMNMGIEPFLVATSVRLICAQRLVRRICTKCAQPASVPKNTLIDAGFTVEEASTVKIMKGKGCDNCSNTGYKGRTGLYEVMEIDDELRELILVGASSMELKKKAIEHGMITLRRSGLTKIMQGVTTLEEVERESVQG